MTWIYNIAAMTATHESGLRIQFEMVGDDADGLFGTVVGVVPDSIARQGRDEVLRLITEAGAGMTHALSIRTPKEG